MESADNLGNHIATQTLNLNGQNIINGDTVTASAFVGDGSGLTNIPTLNGWSLTGNAGTVFGTNFIGTTDNVPLDFRVNNTSALRLEYPQSGNKVNIIAGYSGNSASSGVYGATVFGGGDTNYPNQVQANFGLVAGGVGNVASGISATVVGGEYCAASGFRAIVAGGYTNYADGSGAAVLGGSDNHASGFRSTVLGGLGNYAESDYSLAAGSNSYINASHSGSILFADYHPGIFFYSAAANEFAARATGGFRFVTAINASGTPTKTVSIDNSGTVTAAAFVGDGSGLTGITAPGDNLGDHTATQNIKLNGHYLSGDGGNEGVYVLGNGNVGIGTNNPGALLEVNGQVKITGGTPGVGKVLTSDATGNATWQNQLIGTEDSLKVSKIPDTYNSGNNDDLWRDVSDGVTKSFSFENESKNYKIEANQTLRLTGGTGIDPFEIRVKVKASCSGTTFYSEVTSFTPPEGISDHDNFLVVPYLDVLLSDVIPCTPGTLTFTLQTRNTGDDVWESKDRILIVTPY